MDPSTVEEIVRWRMGSAYDAPVFHWRDSRLNYDYPAALNHAHAGAVSMNPAGFFVCTPPSRHEYTPESHLRLINTAEDVFHAWRVKGGTPLSVFMAMNFSRLFGSVEYIGPATSMRCVQVSGARPIAASWRAQAEIVLWPLSEHSRNWRLPGIERTPWERRRPDLLWRGETTGMSYVPGAELQPVLTGIRETRLWLDAWLTRGEADDAEVFDEWAETYQRLAAVSMCRHIRGTDVRFIPGWNGDRRAIDKAEKHLGMQIATERIEMHEYLALRQQYKYVLSLAGFDVSPSLRHDLLSGCLVLMPRPFWENSWSMGLEPGRHYIELRADLADLEERLQWCRDNDNACREVAQEGLNFAQANFEPSLEAAVQSRLAEHLAHVVAESAA